MDRNLPYHHYDFLLCRRAPGKAAIITAHFYSHNNTGILNGICIYPFSHQAFQKVAQPGNESRKSAVKQIILSGF
jgi:hypothetical protein